jgi:hypothetical protein
LDLYVESDNIWPTHPATSSKIRDRFKQIKEKHWAREQEKNKIK